MKIEEIVCEDILDESLNRILSMAKTHDFAIITAYRFEENGIKLSVRQNIIRNRNLRSTLDQNKLGAHPLVGHWQECTLSDVEYKDCPKDKLVDVIERSYFVTRPEKMSVNFFKNLLLSLAEQYNQNAIILKIGKDINAVAANGSIIQNLGTHITLDKIGQAYSQYVRNLNRPFIFERAKINEI